SVVPRVALVSVTVAPGMAPPCASCTVPVMVPVATCACAGEKGPATTASSRAPAAATHARTVRFMGPPAPPDTYPGEVIALRDAVRRRAVRTFGEVRDK